MAQPYTIINLRKRLKANGYTDICIKETSEVTSVGEKIYTVKAVCPFSCCQETRAVTVSEAETILRKHKPVTT